MKLIKFGFIVIFFAFIKKISSLGKKVQVNIGKGEPLGFAAEKELENTKLLELKKLEKDVNINQRKKITKNKIENEKQNESTGKEKEGILFNLNIDILNQRSAGCKSKEPKPATHTNIQKPIIKEEIPTPKIKNDQIKKDLGLSKDNEKEFLKEADDKIPITSNPKNHNTSLDRYKNIIFG
jgi:hypothetical protein